MCRDKSREMKEIDLLHLTPETDVEVLVNQVSLRHKHCLLLEVGALTCKTYPLSVLCYADCV